MLYMEVGRGKDMFGHLKIQKYGVYVKEKCHEILISGCDSQVNESTWPGKLAQLSPQLLL